MVASSYKSKDPEIVVAVCRISAAESEEIDRIGSGRFRSRAKCLQYLLRLGLEAEKRALAAHDNPSAQTTR